MTIHGIYTHMKVLAYGVIFWDWDIRIKKLLLQKYLSTRTVEQQVGVYIRALTFHRVIEKSNTFLDSHSWNDKKCGFWNIRKCVWLRSQGNPMSSVNYEKCKARRNLLQPGKTASIDIINLLSVVIYDFTSMRAGWDRKKS